MVLFSFSILSMIDLIKTGRKHQTTRTPRKPRINGEPAYKVGDKVQLYYRSRMAPDCRNCLNTGQNMCPHITTGRLPEPGDCPVYRNFFGESEIIDIIHYHHGDYKERYHEVWMGYTLELASKEDKDAWAIADGFTSWKQASLWFALNTDAGIYWADQNLDVILWDESPIIARWRAQGEGEQK